MADHLRAIDGDQRQGAVAIFPKSVDQGRFLDAPEGGLDERPYGGDIARGFVAHDHDGVLGQGADAAQSAAALARAFAQPGSAAMR